MKTRNDVLHNNNETTNRIYNLTIDPRLVHSKPSEDEKTAITRNLTVLTGLTINEFATYVSQPFGYTWSGGIFDGKRSNKNWLRQSIFGVDFDKGTLTIDEILSRSQQFGIIPQLWYSTFSDKPEKRKFRVLFFLDSPITDVRIHKLIYDGLLTLYPEADTTCKDASRYFFGGVKSVVTNTNPIPTNQFIDALSINVISSDSNSLRKLPLAADYYTGLNSAGKQPFYYNINGNDQISAEMESPTTTSLQGGKKVRIDFELARTKVKILDEFLNGVWLTHPQLFGLATNLVPIEGGFQLMKKTMERFNNEGKTQYTQNNLNILPYVNKVKYYPSLIQSFSPYPKDSELFDIISATRDIRGHVERLDPIQKIKLKEAENLLQMKYEDVIKNGETGKIYLFQVPTAIGKTESLLDTMATIALPTNNLKNEIGERMKIKHVRTPDQVTFENESINGKRQYYNSIGLPEKATGILYHMINSKFSNQYSPKDVQMASKFINELNESTNSTEAILTTHKRAFFTEFSHDTLIFDEDPINSLFEIKEMRITDMYELFLRSGMKELKSICDKLESVTLSEIYTTPTFTFDIDELIEKVSSSSGIKSNVFQFFNSSYFMRTNDKSIHYIIRRELPINKKIIIMSATIPIYIYQQLFGERIEVVGIQDVEQTGTVTQYTNRSCSRQGLSKYGEKMGELLGDIPVITFKDLGHFFQNPIKEMYFGNCSGYDSMKGKDLAVVGTPHRNPVEYFLIAKVLGVNFKTTETTTTMTFVKIDYNGFRFKFKCFDNEELRNIQLSLIESDLIQAVGRARTLRTSAHVDLYSNFPLRISNEFMY